MLRLLLVFFVWCAEKLLCPDPDYEEGEATTIENFSFRIESFDMKAPVETWLQKIKISMPRNCDLPDFYPMKMFLNVHSWID